MDTCIYMCVFVCVCVCVRVCVCERSVACPMRIGRSWTGKRGRSPPAKDGVTRRSGKRRSRYVWNALVAVCAGEAWTRMHSWKMSQPSTMGFCPKWRTSAVPLIAIVATLKFALESSNAIRTAASVLRSGVMITKRGASARASGMVAEFSVFEIEAPGCGLSVRLRRYRMAASSDHIRVGGGEHIKTTTACRELSVSTSPMPQFRNESPPMSPSRHGPTRGTCTTHSTYE